MTVLLPVPALDDTLQRARGGDHDAFADLVAAHESVVYSIAYHVFADRHRAEEVAQDVFLQLYRNLERIDSPSHLLFWLRQVTSRKCIDELRRSGPRRVSLEDAGEPVVMASDADPLAARRLRKLVASLPDVQRVVVTLRYQEDLDPREIGPLLGMPVNTIKSHLHRALETLRKDFGA